MTNNSNPSLASAWVPSSLEGKADPEIVSAILESYRRINLLLSRVQQGKVAADTLAKQLAGPLSPAGIRDTLSAKGAAPLPIDGLNGVAALPQNAVRMSSALPSYSDPASQHGALAAVGTSLKLYAFNGKTNVLVTPSGVTLSLGWLPLNAGAIVPSGTRASTPAAASGSAGLAYFQTDTHWLYVSNGSNYIYVAGIDIGTDAQRLALSINASDNGAVFYATDTYRWWAVAGGAWTPLGTNVGAHTMAIPKLTAGGSNGSITWTADGYVSAHVDPT